MSTKNDILSWRGRELSDSEGEKVGKIEEIYLDTDTNQPEWALVNTGLFGTKSTFVPLRNATAEDDEVVVPYDKAKIKDAPTVEADGRLSRDEESQLYRHYGLDYSDAESGSGLPEGTGREGVERGGDDAMTRSEEELRVGTTQRESGRVRLRKYVETEDVSQTVPVQREEVRVEREPITDANVDVATSGADITEDEHEVVLHEEEVVTEKRAVPKERIRLGKEQVTDEREVSETVRREQIEVDDSGRDQR